MSNALEEIAYHNLCAHEGEHGYGKPEGTYSLLCQFLSCSKDVYDRCREEYAYHHGRQGYHGGPEDGQAQYSPHTMVLACSPVVSHDGLHPLYQTENDGHKDEHHAIDYAISSNGHVTSEVQQSAVEQEYHQAGTGIHQEGTHAYGETLAYDIGFQPVNASAEVQQLCGTAEQICLDAESYHLGQDGGPCCPLYTPLEFENEDGVKYHVGSNGYERAVHGQLRMSRAA